MESALFGMTFSSALGAGLVAGIFFAFSNFVMGALGRVAPEAGISAMQSINVVVLNPVFLGLFMGTAALSLILAVAALMRWSEPGAGYLLAGGLLYLHWLLSRDDVGQRAAQRQPGGGQCEQRRGPARVDALPLSVDVVEPRADGRVARGVGGVYRGLMVSPTEYCVLVREHLSGRLTNSGATRYLSGCFSNPRRSISCSRPSPIRRAA